MIFDLHSHTTASDGDLTPLALIARALANKVGCLSITDHDTVDAYCEIPRDSIDGLTLCRGIELSAQWHGRGIHIVGLNVGKDVTTLSASLLAQRKIRLERAETISRRLQKKGIEGALAGARSIAGSDNIGRPHFAKYLVAMGVVRDEQQAFRRFLGKGKVGDVQQTWPSVATVTSWILEAGGTPVIAHPAHYRMTNTKLAALVDEFKHSGGLAIEVVSGRQAVELTRKLAVLAEEKGLLASTGSDFHRPGLHWSDVGQQPPLPGHLKPVWNAW